jgi:hypothetical protein
MSFRVKVLIGVALAAFAACHVAAAYKVEAANARPTTDVISLQRD